MNDALGMVETCGLATGIMVADVMVKTANVKLIDAERTKGHGWITIKVTGDVASVNAAVSAGKKKAEEHGHFVSCKVIPRPADAVRDLFCNPQDLDESAEKEKVPPEKPKASEQPTEEKKPEASEQPAEEKKSETSKKPAVEKKPEASEQPAEEKKSEAVNKPAAAKPAKTAAAAKEGKK